MQSLLQEHEPAPKNKATKENEGAYIPTEEERKTIKLVNKIFEKNKKARSKYDSKWADFYRMFRGKQWKDRRPSYRSSEVINLVFQTIQGFVPIMTDSKPRFEYLPENPADIPLADIINEVTEWDWARKNWLMNITEMLYDCHFYGTGLTMLDFDPKGDDGLGSIDLNTQDPFYVFPDPNAPTPNHRRAKNLLIAEPMDLELIRQLFPEKGKLVKADLKGIEILDKSQQKEIRYKSPSDNVIVTSESVDDNTNKEKAVLMTLFLKDDDYEETEEIRVNPETGMEDKVYIQKLKYPKGRLIQMASNVVLKDTELPLEDGFFPIQKCVNYIDPREFWGISEIEQIESTQKLFNKTLSFAMDVMNLMGNPVWIVDTTSEVDTDQLINRPGLVVEKAPGSEVRREMGVPLQPFVMQLLDTFKTMHDGVAGSQDVSRGINPTGVTAASAIESLMQASLTRIRQKSRNLDAYLQDLGQHYLSFVLQYYTYPRIVRITDKNNPELTKYFKFAIEDVEDENGESRKIAKVRQFSSSDQGAMLGEEQVYEINGKFDVKVSTGSSLPFSKMEKENRLFQLYDRKLIDAEEVLKGLDYPNYQGVLERLARQAPMPM